MQDRAVAAVTCRLAGAKMNPIRSAPAAAAAAACSGSRKPQILMTLPRAKSCDNRSWLGAITATSIAP